MSINPADLKAKLAMLATSRSASPQSTSAPASTVAPVQPTIAMKAQSAAQPQTNSRAKMLAALAAMNNAPAAPPTTAQPNAIATTQEQPKEPQDTTQSAALAPRARPNPALAALTAKMQSTQALQTKSNAAPLAEMQARINALPTVSPTAQLSQVPAPETTKQGTGTSAIVNYNKEQLEAIALGDKGVSFCLIGAAGTGKTTTEREVVRKAAERIRVQLNIAPENFTPSKYIRVIAFTRRAVRNIYKSLSVLGNKYTNCCMTVHKALDYQPVKEDRISEAGDPYTTTVFRPQYNKQNQNTDIQLIIVDEASTLGYQILFRQLTEAFPNAYYIFIGDLNQLKPVMDDPTLAYALASLPVVELKEVHRQALGSPGVAFQHSYTLKGKVPRFDEIIAFNKDKKGLHFEAVSWPKFAREDRWRLAQIFVKQYIAPSFAQGLYNPDDCVILMPYQKEKTFGAIEVNNEIAEMLGKARNAMVYEIVAGSTRKYLAEGDLVLHDRKECIIVDISPNPKYFGVTPMQPSPSLSRHGYYTDKVQEIKHDMFGDLDAVDTASEDFQLALAANIEDEADGEEEQARKASHIITVRDRETDDVFELKEYKQVKDLEFSYAITIHKSQGSEWRKVYVVMHETHANVTREMLYTAMTRYREELVVFYSKGPIVGTDISRSSIAKAINRQEIVGKTWQEKAQVYRAKLNNGDMDAPVNMFKFPDTEIDYEEY